MGLVTQAAGDDDDESWRTGPVVLSKAAAAESAKRAALTRYTAFGRRPENIIKNPGNRRLLSELQHGMKPRRMSQGRLRELSTTKLGLQLQEQMAALAASSDSRISSLDGSQFTRVGRRRPQSAAVAGASARKPRRRRIRLKDVPPESLAALKLLLSSCGLPTQYASALACFGFSSVGELTRATYQNLLDVGLRPGHARALQRLMESSFDSEGLPLRPTEQPTEPVRQRPKSAPPGRTAARNGLAVSVEATDDMIHFAENYSNPTPQVAATPGSSPAAGNAANLESLLSTLELTNENSIPQAPLSPEQAVSAEIASAAADVAADMLVMHSNKAGFAKPSTSPSHGRKRPQSARPVDAVAPVDAAAQPGKAPQAVSSEPVTHVPSTLTLDEMEERLESEVLKLDELEQIESELQAEIALLRAAGTRAGVVTGDGSKVGGKKKTKARGRGTGRGSRTDRGRRF